MRRGSLASALSSLEIQKLVPSFGRALSHQNSHDQSHTGLSNSQSWKNAQQAILCIFQQKELSVLERTMLSDNMREIADSDIGRFVHDFYRDHLLKQAMTVLLKQIQQNHALESMQAGLMKTWNSFYKQMLPLLQSIFFDISLKLEVPNVKDVTLLAFRDHVVLKLDESLFLQKPSQLEQWPETIQQMLLVLQHVREAEGFTEHCERLEGLVAVVVCPFLGYRGYYSGEKEPSVKSNRVAMRKQASGKKREELLSEGNRLQVPALERVRLDSGVSRKQDSVLGRKHSQSISYESELLSPQQSLQQMYRRRHSVQFEPT